MPAAQEGRRKPTAKRRRSAAAPKVSVQPDRVAVVHGNDDFLVGRAVSGLLSKARSAQPELEATDLDAVSATPAALAEAVSPSLFGEDRVVIVRGMRKGAEDMAAAVLSVAADLPDGVRLIVADTEPGGRRSPSGATGAEGASGTRGSAAARKVVPVLASGGAYDVVCKGPATARDRTTFVRDEVSAGGASITGEAAAVLVDVVGSDTRELASAAGQLVADMSEPGVRSSLAVADVERFHRGRAEVTGFAIADMALAGDVTGAMEALRRAAVIGVHPLLVADALASGVRSLTRVAAATGGRPVGPDDADRVGREISVPGWKVRRLAGEAQKWTPAGLIAASQRVASLNAALKGAGTVADEQYALERTVADLAAARGRG